MPAYLGAAPGALAGHVTRADRLFGPLAGRPTPALGTVRASGSHRLDRAAGVVPHTSIGTEAHWTKSGWHGWVYGWKLHLVSTVASVWTPLAAELTPANVADNELAPTLLADLPVEARFVLGALP